MGGIKTDNDFTGDKVALRLSNLPAIKGRPVKVLDVFGGKGVMWAAVSRLSPLQIERTAIDNRHDLETFHIHGDANKVLGGLDLAAYDVIDLDAYGIPADELHAVFCSEFKGVVFLTAIQTMQGQIPKRMLSALGFPDAISRKAPTLPARRGWELVLQYLAVNGVRRVRHRSKHRKHYLMFSIA